MVDTDVEWGLCGMGINTRDSAASGTEHAKLKPRAALPIPFAVPLPASSLVLDIVYCRSSATWQPASAQMSQRRNRGSQLQCAGGTGRHWASLSSVFLFLKFGLLFMGVLVQERGVLVHLVWG
jgi:hypothetical protein